MNGRVYDPILGRFLSADPNVDGVSDAQGFNRYSYVGNNPLGATDPTGFFSLKDALKIVAIVVVGVVTAGAGLVALGAASSLWAGMGMVATASFGTGWAGFANAVVAGAAGGFGSGFAGSLLNGGSIGDAFKAGVVGAVVGGVSAGLAFGIGEIAQANAWFRDYGLNHLAHGVAQGGVTEALGGEFRHGFYAAAFTSAFAGPISRAVPGGTIGQTVAAAIVGGTASRLGGGKFANGAVSGAFTYLFNDAAHPGGIHIEKGAYSTDEDVAMAEKQLAELRVSKTEDGTPTEIAKIIAEIEASGKRVVIWPGKLDGEFSPNSGVSAVNGEGTGGIITYNPQGGRVYSWKDKQPYLRSIGIDTLAHELTHARDAAFGIIPRGYPNREYEPVRVQNQIRAIKNVGLRETHGGNPIPLHDKYGK